jgi:hypothetical protein
MSLQLNHMRLIAEMARVPYSEIVPHMFGSDYDLTADFGGFLAASTNVPDNSGLLVLRVQCYAVNIDSTATDYLFYRSYPEEDSRWILGKSETDTGGLTWAKAYLDTDVFLIFPSQKYANLLFNPVAPIPVTGQWIVRTIAYGYIVPVRVVDALQDSQALTSGF